MRIVMVAYYIYMYIQVLFLFWGEAGGLRSIVDVFVWAHVCAQDRSIQPTTTDNTPHTYTRTTQPGCVRACGTRSGGKNSRRCSSRSKHVLRILCGDGWCGFDRSTKLTTHSPTHPFNTHKHTPQKQLEHAMDLYDRHDRALKQQQRSKQPPPTAATAATATAAAVAAASGVASISGDEYDDEEEEGEEDGRRSSVSTGVEVGVGGGEGSPASRGEGPERKRARHG